MKQLLEKIKQHKTVIIVSHDPQVRRYADHKVVIEASV
jgi:ABC-type lipoprotein export system ATPase subunit